MSRMSVRRAARQAVLLAVVAVVAAQPVLSLQADAGHRPAHVGATDPEWLVRLKAWSEAVTHHVPGKLDDAAQELAAWSADDVHTVVSDYFALIAQARRASRHTIAWEAEHKKLRLNTDEIRTMAVFRDHTPAGASRTARRAAMLHADVALLAPLDFSRSTAKADTAQVLDGVIVGYDSQSAHWLVGRQLLDAVEPDPAADPFVRLWYHAIAASFLEDGNLAAAKPHLERAIAVLPSDANVQYESGYYHQANAAPSIRAILIMQERTAARWNRSGAFGFAPGETLETHKKTAERRFRRAVTLDPSHAEARARLGQALLELNRAEEAGAQLRQAVVAAGSDATLSYLAHMLLGQAEERLGHRQAALACYEKAAALFPEARSPRFALAALDRRAGNRATSWQALEQAVEPPVPEQLKADPWWALYRWQARSAKVLLGELRAMASAEGGL